MGRKKSKERENNLQDDAVSAPSDIFKNLFGDIAGQNAAGSSIFSDNNPFRRKPQESALGFGSVEDVENPKKVDSLDSDIAELKKRKSNKEKKPNFNSDSAQEATVTPLDTNKFKKDEIENINLGFESNEGEERNPNSVTGGKDGTEKKKRKKRKRDEVEREYEARKYGVVEVDKAEDGEEKLGGKVVGQKRKKVDDAADMLVSKEGFDDESKLLRTVFVGNLPLKVKKKALLKEFSCFGEVESVRIRSVPILDSKKPRKHAVMLKRINDAVDSVHAYIVFKTEQSAEASLAHNMAVVEGNHIRVDRACPPRKKLKGENAPLYDNKRTVFVGNLPFDVKDEEIYQLFCGINNLESSIEAVRVIRDPHTSVGKGIAYVLFRTTEAANLIVKKRYLKLRDRDLRLYRARADSTPSKRKNPSPAWAANSPAKKFAVDSRMPPHSDNRSNTKAAMSYQGLFASKSGVQKKAHHSKSIGPVKTVKMKRKTQEGDKLKERTSKRPSVAARKAKALKGSSSSGASKQAGTKRKLDSRTPDNSHRKKKAKKFR